MRECLTCSWIAKFKKLPGFVNLTTDGQNPILTIIINGKRLRLGADSLSMLYDDVKERIEKSNVPQGT